MLIAFYGHLVANNRYSKLYLTEKQSCRPMIRYGVILLLATTNHFGFASPVTRTTNELTKFDEILAAIRTDAWIDVKITDNEKNASACRSDVATIWQSAAAGHKWALHMLDADSRAQSGILLGNLQNLGTYDQCVKIAARHNPTSIQSQYCTVTLSIPPHLFSDTTSLLLMNTVSVLGQSAGSALSFTSAMCLPWSCSEDDISVIVSEIIKQTTESETPETKVAQVICSRPKDGQFTTGEYLFTAFIAVAVSFLLYCTICDFVTRREAADSSLSRTYEKFSLHKSAICILSTEITPDTIPVLNGLRVLGTMHIIIMHRILNSAISPKINPQGMFDLHHVWYATFFYIIPFVVDNFFIMSGFLLIHNLRKSIYFGKKFNILECCINRYARLTPAFVVIILITIFYLHRLGSGPIWGITETYLVGYCMESWWTNFLYLQNVINAEHMCLPHLWYLAVEMQLFLVAQVLLLAFFRWPKCQKSILGFIFVGSLLAPPILFASNGYTNAFFKMTLETSLPKLRDNLIHEYMSTIPRSFPYLAGTVLGYVTVNQQLRVTKLQAKICWVVACSLMLICFLATRYLYLESYKYDVVFEVAYSALVRPAWSVAIVWIIYACMHGHGGSLAKFLSAPVFLPLSRISYCTYLVHFLLQSSMVTGVQVPIFHSNFAMLNQVWGDLLNSSFLGFLLSLFVETPIRILAKTLTNSRASQASLAQKSSNTNSEKNTDSKIKKIE